MHSEGQVSRLYKYNGLSPRMFHTAWHFHYLKPHHHSAGSNLPQMYMWLNATHAPDCQEASNDISVRTDDSEDEAPAGSGDVHEWKECIPWWLAWPYAGDWTKELIQTPIPSRLDAFASPDASFTKIHLISPQSLRPPHHQSAAAFHLPTPGALMCHYCSSTWK